MSKSIKKWLKQLDLGQYVDLFAENDIDWELLPELDHESLKDIGITSTGHRLRIIKAAAVLAPEAIDTAPVTQNASTPIASPSGQTQAERRQLTVMFCDLVGSTDLSGRLDPEDLREVVRAYQQTVANVIKRFDGHIVQYLGDGLLIYFGYPVAHEDDAQRAVHASVGISDAMPALNTRLQAEYGVQLSVRIGIHTGPVVVGQMGDLDHQQNLAMGETPNFAARLQGLAEPGAVLISDRTRRLLGELFELDPRGAQHLKGIAEPMQVFAVRGERRVETRFAAGQGQEMATIIGREFEYLLLAAVILPPQAELTTSLRQLIDAELIFGRGDAPESSYSFKHALVRDAAYQSLLKAKRRELHTRVAEALESESPPAAPELLAYHYTEAGLAGPAIANWQLAGEQAMWRAGNTEAIQHFQKALELLASQPENSERNATELKILTNLGPLMMMMKGGSSTEVGEIYERAEELAGQMESSAELVPAIFGRWAFHAWGGRFYRADQVALELFDVAGATGDEALLLQAHHAAWPIRMLRGDFEVSREHVDKGLTIYDYEKHKHHASLYLGHDPAVCAHSLKAGITWALGFPDCAHDHAAQALQHARRMGHASTLAYGLLNVCLYHAARGDEMAMRSTADELWRLSNERQLVFTGAGAQVFGGWAMVKQGQTKAGLERMREGIATWDRLAVRLFRQAVHCLYAERLIAARLYTHAMEELKQGLALSEQTGERWWESRVLQLHAQAVLEEGDSEAAEALLHKSIEVARRQKAKSWELRATINLSRLWAGKGKRDDAHSLLSPIYDWFTEGFDTADLKEAKALLDELR